MIDYSQLKPEEKIDLWLKQKNLSDDSYKKVEEDILAKEIMDSSKQKDIKPIKQKSYPKNHITAEIDNMGIDNQQKEYLKLLGKLESGYNSQIENKQGYAGLYQFGADALSAVGLTKNQYINDSMLQHGAALKLANINTRGLEKYYGKTFNGILLNKYNLAAAAHLGGRGNLNKLLSGKITDFKDANGTSIISRLKLFENIY